MGQALNPRVIRSGPYKPTNPRTGDDDGTIFRKNNLMTLGRNGRYYERVYSGEGDLGEDLAMVALTGTLTLTENSEIVIGSGTLFLTECHLGQRILAIPADGSASYPVVPRQIISDTEMKIWWNPTATVSSLTGWQMPRLFTMNQKRGAVLWGNAIELDKGSLLSVGSGTLFLNGLTLPGSSLVMTREPQISIFDPVTGNYANFTLGMDTPVPPTLAAVGGGVKDMQAGNYSIVIAPARKETVGFNNPSLRADVTLATGDKVEITFPAMDIANGQNAWNIYVTTFAFSLGSDLNYLNGPWFFHSQVTTADVPAAGGAWEIEWYDAEVEGQELASFDNDPPSQAELIELLNFTPVWISCRGKGFTRGATTVIDPSPGPFIEPAKQRNIEAAPARIQFASSPPEVIIGATSGEGRIYLLTPDHLQIAQATPDPSVPVLIRPFWKGGFATIEQLVVLEGGDLYGHTMRGPMRQIGSRLEEPNVWAADVEEIMRDWLPGHVLLGYNPLRNFILFYHIFDHLNDAGYWTTRVLGFSLSHNFWAFDRLMTSDTQDQIVSGLTTVGNNLELLVGGRGTMSHPEIVGEGEFELPPLEWAATGTVV